MLGHPIREKLSEIWHIRKPGTARKGMHVTSHSLHGRFDPGLGKCNETQGKLKATKIDCTAVGRVTKRPDRPEHGLWQPTSAEELHRCHAAQCSRALLVNQREHVGRVLVDAHDRHTRRRVASQRGSRRFIRWAASSC